MSRPNFRKVVRYIRTKVQTPARSIQPASPRQITYILLIFPFPHRSNLKGFLFFVRNLLIKDVHSFCSERVGNMILAFQNELGNILDAWLVGSAYPPHALYALHYPLELSCREYRQVTVRARNLKKWLSPSHSFVLIPPSFVSVELILARVTTCAQLRRGGEERTLHALASMRKDIERTRLWALFIFEPWSALLWSLNLLRWKFVQLQSCRVDSFRI
jgi:hypothetical protein